MFAPPSPEERARLKSEHAHRFPDNATFAVLDGMARVSLPFVIGNPSGACEVPAGAPPASAAWSLSLRAGFGLSKGGPAVAQAIAADCTLYPPPDIQARAFARWPDLRGDIADVVARKIGAGPACMVEPSAIDEAPEAIAAALLTRPAAAWRWYEPRSGVRYAVVIEPPASQLWRMRREALTKPGADVWAALRALVEPCAVAVADGSGETWKPATVADVMRRFPGFAVGLSAALSSLMGATGEAEISDL